MDIENKSAYGSFMKQISSENKGSLTNLDQIEDDYTPELRNSSVKREMHDLELSLVANEVVKFKNEYMKKIMKHERNQDSKFIDFEALDAIYISNKKLGILRDNFIVRLLSSYIYKQHNVKSRMGYLPGLIFFLLMIEMVSSKESLKI